MLPTKMSSWPALIIAVTPSQDQLLSTGSIYQWLQQAQGQSRGTRLCYHWHIYVKTSKGGKDKQPPFLANMGYPSSAKHAQRGNPEAKRFPPWTMKRGCGQLHAKVTKGFLDAQEEDRQGHGLLPMWPEH